eukprot:8084424-Lingulodinium_polyedra.AAC.1
MSGGAAPRPAAWGLRRCGPRPAAPRKSGGAPWTSASRWRSSWRRPLGAGARACAALRSARASRSLRRAAGSASELGSARTRRRRPCERPWPRGCGRGAGGPRGPAS